MDPVTALLGAMASLPQCMQAARQLYDMRSRFKDASLLITAIYSESMVIAASLSQVQNLLHYQTLQSKPQLLETFDRAITGCRVVYECLQGEVRDLITKVENENLMFKDKTKFLWKADNFKELLQQIRGQQMTLSLLIQGLQMESLAEIRSLIVDNSATLDKVVQRSKTLRQEHPNVKVPESVFNRDAEVGDAKDVDSILKSTDFAFDDQVLNSKAYRKAMALYTSKNKDMPLDLSKQEVEEDDSTIVDSTEQDVANVEDTDKKSPVKDGVATSARDKGPESEQKKAETTSEEKDLGTSDSIHQELFDSLEHDILAFMPSLSSNASYLTNSTTSMTEKSQSLMENDMTPARLRQSVDGNSDIKKEITEEKRTEEEKAYEKKIDEKKIGEKVIKEEKVKEKKIKRRQVPGDGNPPPLPPRRPSGQPSPWDTHKKRVSVSSDNSTITSDVLSKVSSVSSFTTLSSTPSISTISRKPTMSASLPEVVMSRSISDMNGQVFPIQHQPLLPSQLQNTEMHNIWMALLNSERMFFDRMTKLRTMFYDHIIQTWPLLEKHLEAVLTGEQLAHLSKEILLQTMEQQLQDKENAVCNPTVFEQWTNKSQKLYREYCQRMPHTASSLRTTQNMDSTFAPFVNTLDLSKEYFNTSMEEHFRLPIVQLQLYIDSLSNLKRITGNLDNTPAAHEEAQQLQAAIDAVSWLQQLTYKLLEDSQNREDVQNVEKRLHTLNATHLTQLQLLEPDRRVLFQGGMAIKLKGHGSWAPVHVVLLDNYLLWGKAKLQKKGKVDKILVLEPPIAIKDLDATLQKDGNQFQKTTMFDKVAQGLVLYLISINDKTAKDKPHLLGAFGYQERNEWWNHLSAATAAAAAAAQEPGAKEDADKELAVSYS